MPILILIETKKYEDAFICNASIQIGASAAMGSMFCSNIMKLTNFHSSELVDLAYFSSMPPGLSFDLHFCSILGWGNLLKIHQHFSMDIYWINTFFVHFWLMQTLLQRISTKIIHCCMLFSEVYGSPTHTFVDCFVGDLYYTIKASCKIERIAVKWFCIGSRSAD